MSRTRTSHFKSLRGLALAALSAPLTLFTFSAFSSLSALSSCSEAGPAETSLSASPSLPRQSLQIGEQVLKVEVASTPESMAQGLMYRKSMPENEGMLFVFPQPQRASFWMKNTRIPLSIAYLDADMTILEIYDLKPYDQRSTVSRSTAIAYALEVNQGWFQKHDIEPGTRVIPL